MRDGSLTQIRFSGASAVGHAVFATWMTLSSHVGLGMYCMVLCVGNLAMWRRGMRIREAEKVRS